MNKYKIARAVGRTPGFVNIIHISDIKITRTIGKPFEYTLWFRSQGSTFAVLSYLVWGFRTGNNRLASGMTNAKPKAYLRLFLIFVVSIKSI